MSEELKRINAANAGKSLEEAQEAEQAHFERYKAFKTADIQERVGKIGHPEGGMMNVREAQSVGEDLFDQSAGDPNKVTDEMIAETWKRKREGWKQSQ